MEEGLRYREPLLHPLRERLHPLARPAREFHGLQDRLGAGREVRPRHPPEPPRVREDLEGTEVPVELGRLDHGPHLAQRLPRLALDVDAEQGRVSAGGAEEVREDLDRRGLSRPVRPEVAEAYPGGDGEVERPEGGELPVILPEPFDGDRVRHDPCYPWRDMRVS